ncbi:MAG: glycosyltransferase family 2 protein, partial [Anaerolineales bacterium]|nr:glycosyltransferase family 2 protein [Anaerolineales bacterium]
WSPELLFSKNYLERAFIRTQLLTEAAHLSMDNEVYEDLVYRSIEAAECIEHVPLVAVHTGRASNSELGTPAAEQHLRSLRKHAKRIGIHDHPQVLYTADGITHLTWPIEEKKVAIIIPTRDKPDYLRRCLKSLMDTTTYDNYTITLVDSGSRDPETLSYYKEMESNPQIKILDIQGEFNFSAALNFGAQHTKEELLIFLNNDVEIIQPSWLEEMVRWSNIPEIGIVGGKLLYPDGKIQHAGIIMGMEGHASHIFGGAEDGENGPFGSVNWYRNYSAVTAACMGMRREVYEQIGGFDEDYKLVFNDVEICLRAINAGYRVVYTPFAQLIHHEGGTRGHFIPTEDIRLGYEHMKDIVAQGDPYFNPNLSNTVRIPTLKRPFEETSTERLQNIVKYS